MLVLGLAGSAGWAQAPAAPPASGQEQPAPAPVPADENGVSGLEPLEELRRRLEGLKKIEAPGEEDKARIDRLQQAIDALGRTEGQREKSAAFRELAAQLSQRLAKAAEPIAPPPTPPEGAPLEEVEQAQKVAAAEVSAASDVISQIDTQAAQLVERRRLLPDELAKARTALAEAEQAAQGAAAQPAGSTDSVRQLALARLAEAKSQVALLDADLASLDARQQLLTAQREAAVKRHAAAESVAGALRARLDEHRRSLVESARESARAQGGETPTPPDPKLAEAAARTLEVANALREVGTQSNAIAEETKRLDDQLKRLRREFETDQERADVAGATGELATVLNRQRQALPSRRELQAALERHRELRIKTELARIDWNVALDRLQAEVRALPESPASAPLRQLLEERREKYLKPLLRALDEVSASLTKLVLIDGELGDTVESYRAFIDERILWSRSGPPLWEIGVGGIAAAAHSLWAIVGRPEEWSAVAHQLRENPGPALGGVVLSMLLAATGFLRKRWLARLAEEVSRGRSDRFALTLEALGATLLWAIGIPAAFVGIGLSLHPNELGTALTAAIASTFLGTSLWVGILGFTRYLVDRSGVADAHFGWNVEQTTLLRRVARRLLQISVPLAIFAGICSRLSDPETGRFAAFGAARSMVEGDPRVFGLIGFALFLLVIVWSVWRLFRPSRGLFAHQIRANPGALLSRLRGLWFVLIMAVPVASLALSISGWGYTAAILTWKLVLSACVALGAVILEATLLRALEFGARAFASKSRERLREAAPSIHPGDSSQRAEIRTEVASVSRQTRATIALFRSILLVGGLAYVWSDLLPALRALDAIQIWEGAEAPVTLGHLLWALLIGVVAALAARNLPGAAEVLVLQHTGMSPAGRYAVAAVIGYGVVIAGVVFVASKLGLSWQSVQWLVAAISVGLGFGLQEIVGNFVAGLIVLFEQPVRVGDIVTVGDRTGQVARIRIRATTIRDPDGKDLIVPNKHLITERVLNWTLSGSPLRLIIPVGVAYGTDLALAERLLIEAANRVPQVLKENVTGQLMGFGANSIDFELRCYVASINDLMPARHELTRAIEQAFTEAGVSIAFPQLDLHVAPASIDRLLGESARGSFASKEE